MNDIEIIRKLILEHLDNVYWNDSDKHSPENEISNLLELPQKDVRAHLDYLGEKQMITGIRSDDGSWYCKITAKGIDELKKLTDSDDLNEIREELRQKKSSKKIDPKIKHYLKKAEKFYLKRCVWALDLPELNVKVSGNDAKDVAFVADKFVKSIKSDPKISINISGSQIGILNLGEQIGDIENNLTIINQAANHELVSALKLLTEKVLITQEFSMDNKKEIIEQIEELTSQATTIENQRKTGIIKSICKTLKESLSTLNEFQALWPSVKIAIEQFFQIII